MNPDGLPGEGVEREPDTEAGGYIEDDVPAWQALVEAVREYGSQFDRMTAHLGTPDAAAEVLAGSMLSWMADQRGVFVHSVSSQPAPDAGLRRAAEWLVSIHADDVTIPEGSALWEDLQSLKAALAVPR